MKINSTLAIMKTQESPSKVEGNSTNTAFVEDSRNNQKVPKRGVKLDKNKINNSLDVRLSNNSNKNTDSDSNEESLNIKATNSTTKTSKDDEIRHFISFTSTPKKQKDSINKTNIENADYTDMSNYSFTSTSKNGSEQGETFEQEDSFNNTNTENNLYNLDMSNVTNSTTGDDPEITSFITFTTELDDQEHLINKNVSKRSARKRKAVKYALDDDEETVQKISRIEKVAIKTEIVEDSPKKPRKRGRPKIVKEDSGSNLKRADEQIGESDNNEEPDQKTTTKVKVMKDLQIPTVCAICNEEMPKESWKSHSMRKHNNLAWRVGDPPLDLNDEKVVVRILNGLYKKKVPLRCQTCSQVKKSVLGLLSHQRVCSKSFLEVASMKVACESCGKMLLPVSMQAHQKYCKGVPSLLMDKLRKEVDDTSALLVLKKRKREAAMKADDMIQMMEDDCDNSLFGKAWFKNKEFWLSPELLTRIKNNINEYGTEKCDVSGCEFDSSDAVAFAQHYQSCIINSKEELYVCKYCVKTQKSEEEIVAHIKRTHRIKKNTDGNLEISEINDSDMNDTQVAVTKLNLPAHAVRFTVSSITFLLQHRFCTPTTSVLYPPAYNWALKFCNDHFSIKNLFGNWKTSKQNTLDLNLLHQYLPPLKRSLSVSRISTEKYKDSVRFEHVWKSYKLFEAEKLDDYTSVIFCGGQIFSLAWLPTPFDQTADQILAVSVPSSSMDKLFAMDEMYAEGELIQFWNLGPLRNGKSVSETVKLEFCVAHDYGPARCLEWCPSGCYDSEADEGCFKRLGLLAVGCANSQIYVYCISRVEPNSGKILKLKPVLKLTMESNLDQHAYGIAAHVTKISWSKAQGHEIIAAGYANGMVAVFYLNTKSSLLKLGLDSDGDETLMPYRVIKAHFLAVTALHLSHLNNGKRWLMSGSADRSIKYWDLDNSSTPISNFYKATITDGAWINHWLCSLQSFDDCCGTAPTTTIIYQPRNYISEHCTAMYSNCHIWSVSGSEWTNGFVQGNVIGELQGFFPHQLFAGMDSNKSKTKKKVMLGYTDLVEKDLNVDERIAASAKYKTVPKVTAPVESLTDSTGNIGKLNPADLTYREAAEKYGVIFCDFKYNSFKECHEKMTHYLQSKPSKFYNPRPNVHPVQSINKVAFNPNHQCYLHLAAAYQIGFVRISCLNFLEK